MRALISEREAGAGAINDTIVPRLAAAGALPSRVALPPVSMKITSPLLAG